jgi:23S rRNA (pseudouridine1915-N3)-methyltransferase
MFRFEKSRHVLIFAFMKISLLTVGKTDIDWVRKGLETYSSRLVHYVPFSICEIPELKNTSSLTKVQIKDKEGELLLKNIKPADRVILLDEHGKEFRSVEFAEEIRRMMLGGGKDIVFIIGGAYGFSEAVYDRCDGKISLSKMTFSHQMVRVIFTEQLYRAFTIIKGEPYHHE